MKRLLLVLIALLALSLTACTDEKKEDTPKESILGDWIDQDTSGRTYMMAHVDESTIRVYIVANGGKVWTLYWDGTYTAPGAPSDRYTWSSSNNLTGDRSTEFFPFAMRDDHMTFKYENGQLSFTGWSDGDKATITLVHSDKPVTECNEASITDNQNAPVDVAGIRFTPSKAYGRFVETDDDDIDLLYAPHGSIAFSTTPLSSSVTEEMFLDEEEVTAIANLIIKPNNARGGDLELTGTETFSADGHTGLFMSFSGLMYDDEFPYDQNIYLASLINPATNSMVLIYVYTTKDATYDYRTDLLGMMKEAKYVSP